MDSNELLTHIPKPSPHTAFSLGELRTIPDPHPYCITPKHVEVAADRHSGILDESSIEDAEKRGAHCGMPRCDLSYKKHTSTKALEVLVDQNEDLNAIPGLHSYLLSIRDKATELGIDGFCFPIKKAA